MYSNAVSFTYNNKSLSDFSHKMIIGYIDKSEDSFGLDREIVSGSTTMNRNIYHAYNTKYSGKLGFQITLFHEDQKRFTENEVSEVTRWLTSPKSYRKLEFYGCDDRKNDVVYYAIVTKVTPALAGGIAGLKIDFECNAPYGFVEKESNLFDLTNKLETPNHNGSLVLDCGSDELEQYVYPIIEVESPELWTDLQITNHSDNNSTMHGTQKVTMRLIVNTKLLNWMVKELYYQVCSRWTLYKNYIGYDLSQEKTRLKLQVVAK